MKAKGRSSWIALALLGGICFFLLPRQVADLWVAEVLTEARLAELGVAGLALEDPAMEPGLLREVAGANGLSLPAEPEVGSQLFDVDCDGDLDFFTLGEPASHREAGRPGSPGRGDERSFGLYLNDGAGRFREVAGRMGAAFTTPRKAVGSACLDLDRDGLLDLVVLLAEGSRVALWNHLGRRGYLSVVLEPAPGAEGPSMRKIRVEAAAGGRKQVRIAAVGGGPAAGKGARVHFGLGDAKEVERLAVFWKSDRVSEVRDVAANREVHVRE